MANFGLSSLGFLPKQQQDIITEIEASLRSAFGQNINLLPTSVFGQLVGIFSEREALLWQLAEAVYNSQYPAGAEGTSVDNILALTGLTRLPATPTKTAPNENGVVGLVCYGTPGTIIPAGSIVQVNGSPQSPSFTIDSPLTIGVSVNEVQSIQTNFVPDSGSFSLLVGSATGQPIRHDALASSTQLLFSTPPTLGSFVITIGNQSTVPILFSANALDVQAAIQGLGGYGSVSVTGNFTSGFIISWGSASNPRVTTTSNTLDCVTTVSDSLQSAINQAKKIILTPSGNTTLGSNIITSVSSVSGLA